MLHDVAQRADINLMDSTNLAIVFTPNLVSNENPLKAVQMSMVSSTTQKSKDIMELSRQSSHANVVNLPDGPQKHTGTTLGTVVRVCIERYYEIFDEVRDVTEAIPAAEFEEGMKTPPAKRGSPESLKKDLSSETAPSGSKSKDQPQPAPHKYQPRIRGHTGPPPSAASASMAMLAKALADNSPGHVDERQALLDRTSSQSRSYTNPYSNIINDLPNHSETSMHAPSVSRRSGGARSGSGPSGWTGGRGLMGMPKTRSIISIDRTNSTPGQPEKAFSGRESIKLGRGTITSGGTVRKSASAGVVGVGVTANGFFTSPTQ